MDNTRTGYDEILSDLGAEYPDLIVIDAGLATSMMTHRFMERFHWRYFNLGIAEQNAVSLASGLARRGLVPLVHTFSNFIARRAHDQVALSVAWPGCNVKMIGGSCGLYDGRNGPSHMAIDDLAAMTALPGVMVVEPGDMRQTRELMHLVINHDGPAYLRLRRNGAPADLLPGAPTREGTTIVRQAPGARCTLVVGGSMLCEAVLAARLLAGRGIELDLIHVSVLRPLKGDPLAASAARTRLAVTVENHVATGGFGEAVSRILGPLGIRHVRMNLPDEFMPAGDPAWQLSYCGLDAAGIVRRVEQLLGCDGHV
jgi:transketolase